MSFSWMIIFATVDDKVRNFAGCARFSEFWLFWTEHVWMLPLYYEKSDQDTMNWHKNHQIWLYKDPWSVLILLIVFTKERQILWRMCSVVFLAFTLKLPVQTLLSVAPKLLVCARSGENVENSAKRIHTLCFCRCKILMKNFPAKVDHLEQSYLLIITCDNS